MVINNASPIRTELGGTWAVPIAVRIMESTTMILEKEVIEISKKGRRDIMLSASKICMLLLKPGEAMMPAISKAALLGAAA